MRSLGRQPNRRHKPRKVLIGHQTGLRPLEMNQVTDAQQTVVVEKRGYDTLEAVAVLRVVAGFRDFGVQLRPRLPVMRPVHDGRQQAAYQKDGQQH